MNAMDEKTQLALCLIPPLLTTSSDLCFLLCLDIPSLFFFSSSWNCSRKLENWESLLYFFMFLSFTCEASLICLGVVYSFIYSTGRERERDVNISHNVISVFFFYINNLFIIKHFFKGKWVTESP